MLLRSLDIRPRKSGKKKKEVSKGCALALGFWGGVKPSEIRLIGGELWNTHISLTLVVLLEPVGLTGPGTRTTVSRRAQAPPS